MTNTEIWDELGKTDPSATKGFNRAGGFKGTAVKPIWVQRRLTEHFGPAGIGWGVNEPKFDVVTADGEILVYCTVSAWHGDKSNILWGVGGDKVQAKRQSGSFCDDEAFKKAFTDAVGNAFKSIGVAADIHMGLFDDDKYVDSMREEFSEKPEAISDRTRDFIQAKATAAGITLQKVCETMRVKSLAELTEEQGQSVIEGLDQTIARKSQRKAA